MSCGEWSCRKLNRHKRSFDKCLQCQTFLDKHLVYNTLNGIEHSHGLGMVKNTSGTFATYRTYMVSPLCNREKH